MKTYLVADSGYHKEQLSNIVETICPNFREHEEKGLEKKCSAIAWHRTLSHNWQIGISYLCIVFQNARKITCPVGEKNLPNWENKKAWFNPIKKEPPMRETSIGGFYIDIKNP